MSLLSDYKYGDIISYTLGNTDQYTSIIISKDGRATVLDIATTNSSYPVPRAFVFSEDESAFKPINIELIGNIDILKPVKDQFPEIFL